VHRTMEVKADLLHCSKIAVQLPKQTPGKIKNSKLFQSITSVYSAVTSSGSTVSALRPQRFQRLAEKYPRLFGIPLTAA
jgi:hypothetical protein